MNIQQDKTKPNQLVLPLGQTVFLPQTAMGVSYIDKVRTKVYIDNLQRQQGAVCLRGFYEIDLEYHGLEGPRLFKHRVMLPLRAELPGDWLAPLDYDAAELHVIIRRPMLRILSPYVLEFSAQLLVEYVGDRMRPDKPEKCQPEPRRFEADRPLRLEPHLPVWQEQKSEPAAAQERDLTENFAEPGKMRSLLTNAAISRLEAKGAKLAAEMAAAKKSPETEPAAEKTSSEQPALEQSVIKNVIKTPVVETEALVQETAASQEVILISDLNGQENKQLTAAKPIEPAVAEPVMAEEELAAEAEPIMAEVEPVAETEPVMAEAEPAVEAEPVMAEAELTAEAEPVMAEAEPTAEAEPVMAEAEQAASPAEAASELAEAVSMAASAAADEQPEAVETMAEAAPMQAMNRVNANGVRLRVGLREPAKVAPATPKASSGFSLKYYVVKPGDDPMSIALQHNVPLESLRAANQALAGELNPGMVLRIPS